MGKQSKIKAKVKLIIWAVVLTWVFANVAFTLLVPVARHQIGLSPAHKWQDETKFVASWDRQLTSREIVTLIQRTRSCSGFAEVAFYHVLHHGSEPLVIDELILGTESEDLRVVTVCEFALFKLRIEPEERLRNVLNIAVAGGLDPENVKYLYAGGEDTPDDLEDKVHQARGILICAFYIVTNFIDPEEDLEYLPIIMEYTSEEYLQSYWLAKIIGPFKDIPEVDDVLWLFRDEYNEAMREITPNYSDSFNNFIGQSFDSEAFEIEVKQNLPWFNVSYVVIAIWIIATIIYIIKRFKQINLSDSQAP